MLTHISTRAIRITLNLAWYILKLDDTAKTKRVTLATLAVLKNASNSVSAVVRPIVDSGSSERIDLHLVYQAADVAKITEIRSSCVRKRSFAAQTTDQAKASWQGNGEGR